MIIAAIISFALIAPEGYPDCSFKKLDEIYNARNKATALEVVRVCNAGGDIATSHDLYYIVTNKGTSQKVLVAIIDDSAYRGRRIFWIKNKLTIFAPKYSGVGYILPKVGNISVSIVKR